VKKSTIRIVSAIALSWAAVGCDEEIVTGPGFVCDVTNPVRDVTISPTTASLPVRTPARETDVVQLTATATNRLGTARTDVPIVFTSSDPSVATVDSTGLVHAVKEGSVNIKASACSESATAHIVVISAVLTVQVSSTVTTAVVGDTILVTARATGQTGKVADVKFTFSPSPSGLATVTTISDSTARVVALSAGTVTVTAAGEGTTGSVAIVILPKAFLLVAASPAAIDAGGHITCGIITLGRGYCWGLNDLSQLGSTSETLCFRDTQTQTDTLETVVKRCSIVPKRLVSSVAFSAVSAGDSSACAISTVGRVYCWGSNSHGEVGDGSGALKATATLINSGLLFSAVSVGGGHACAIANGGATYCWGQDTQGQLGDARLVNSSTPIPVSGGGQAPANFAKISAGRTHTCALTSDGTAFCWGSNLSGELGNGGIGGFADTPVLVSTAIGFTSIAAGGDSIVSDAFGNPLLGGDYTCGVAIGGAAFCWGSNRSGQLGTGAIGSVSLVPVAVAGGQTFTSVTAGRSHTCALTTGGAVFCWGENLDLQLGRGPQTGGSLADATPVQVTGGELPAAVTFSSISAGVNHTCGVGIDGFAYCWGSNVFGALGNSLQAAFRGFPQRVSTPQ
jgi:alpha-tubulin suppressor-like RCC1 family protein